MKKSKLLGIAALAAMIGLSGCNMLDTTSCAHQWSAWEILEVPTCLEKGVRERTCYLCNRNQTRTINVDTTYGHDWIPDPASDTPKTCTTPGITGSKICSRCYQKRKGSQTELGDHSWDIANPQPSDAKYKDSTCTEAGLIQNKCIYCNATEDVVIKAKGHEAGQADFTGGKMGIVRCSRENCDEVMAYELDVKDAVGYNTPTVRMNQKTGASSKSSWDISSYVGTIIPEGSYDIELEAAMTDASHGTRKLYNMARKDLVVDGDEEGNATAGTPDSVTESPYRYFIKIDSTTYYPTTKESYSDLGLQVGNTNFRYFKFLEGVTLSKDSNSLELIHGSIGYSLFIRSIRFKPHTHDILPHDEPTINGRTGYSLDKCYCGYRHLVAEAKDGVISHKDATLPEDYVRLTNVDDTATYSFNVEESITGSLYLVGRQAVANMDKTPYNIKVTCNDEEIEINKEGKVSSDFFTTTGTSDLANYSNEGRILIGEVTLKENAKYGNNELKITCTGEYNIAINQIVVEARPTGHIHDFVRDPSRDEPATCRTDEKQYFYCSCGQEEVKTIPGTMKEHNLIESYRLEPSCDNTGLVVKVCQNEGCNYNEQTVLPKTHDMSTITAPDGAAYELKDCSKCHKAKEATWMLKDCANLIEDETDGVYAPASLTPKTGNKSDNLTEFTVYKFDVAKRRVTLTYEHDGEEAVQAMFSMFATTKTSNIANCQAYRQTTGQTDNPQTKLELNVNSVTTNYSSSYLNKTVGDLGLQSVDSKVDDNGTLADPVWMDYYKVELEPGTNTIVVNFPTKTQYSLYIGGFRISY